MNWIRQSKSTVTAFFLALTVTVVLGALILTGAVLFSIWRTGSEGETISASAGGISESFVNLLLVGLIVIFAAVFLALRKRRA